MNLKKLAKIRSHRSLCKTLLRLCRKRREIGETIEWLTKELAARKRAAS